MNAKGAVVVGTAATRCFVADVFQQVPLYRSSVNAQNPLHTFPRKDEEVANLLRTCSRHG